MSSVTWHFECGGRLSSQEASLPKSAFFVWSSISLKACEEGQGAP